MDRRTFLRLTGIAFGSMVASACLPSQASDPPTPTPGDAIVVGSGAAGLAAARRLRDAGQRVTILEARDRIGGRAWTSDALGPPIDLGASWIHGTTDNPLTALARAAGLEFIPTNPDRFGSFDTDGRLLSLAEEEPVYAHWLGLIEEVGRRGGQGALADAIAQVRAEPRWGSLANVDAALVARYLDWIPEVEIAADLAADLSELSVAALSDGEAFGGPWVMLDHGYGSLLAPIADGVDIRFGEVATAIAATDDGVAVSTATGRHRADRVIVTVPLGVLKTGSIDFSPALPDSVQGAIDRLGMGTFLKVAMRFGSAVWPGGMDWLGRLGETTFLEFVNLAAVTDEPILVGFATGSQARRLEGLDDDAIVVEAMTALRAVLGSSVPEPEASVITKWGSDPFARGAYSYMAVGATPEDRDALAAPITPRNHPGGRGHEPPLPVDAPRRLDVRRGCGGPTLEPRGLTRSPVGPIYRVTI